MNYQTEAYNRWLESNLSLTNAFSPDSLRRLTQHLLLGGNYRLITEQNTKSRLALTHLWLIDIFRAAKKEYGEDWRKKMLEDLLQSRHRTKEQQYLLCWINGFGRKTLTNVGGSLDDLPTFLDTLIVHFDTLFSAIGRPEEIEQTWLLMMAGAATLSIRGADKSKIGKTLEGVLVRSSLTMLGLEENVNFWMNVDRDLEVDRETDAEIQTQRGRIRMEVGLISSGNQEVVEDKINRVGTNGIVLFDKVGANTRIYETAERHRVKLIQIRHNQPLVAIAQHLQDLVNVPLQPPPQSEEEIFKAVEALPDSIFTNNNSIEEI